MANSGLKTAFSKAHVIEPLYTGGPVASTSDAGYLFTSLERIVLSHVDSGRRICSFSSDTSQVTAIALSPSSRYLATFGESFLLSIFEINDNLDELSTTVYPVHKINRAHDAPVHVAAVDPSSSYLASGSADGIVKVWDLQRGFATHSFKGHSGVISAIAFHVPFPNNPRHLHVITASVDTKIHIYQMEPGNSNAKPLYVLEGHTSVPRGLAMSEDGKWLLSGGRDGVVLLWNYDNYTLQGHSKGRRPVQPKTIPVFERVEALGIMPSDAKNPENLTFYVGGEKGLVSIWEAHSGKKLHSLTGDSSASELQKDEQEGRFEIVDIIHARASGTLIAVHADQNIYFYSDTPLKQRRCVIGYNDEIIDSALLSSSPGNDSHLAVATNSSLIRLYSMDDFNSCLLPGHKDIVLCVKSSLSGIVMGSGSKDNSALIWRRSNDDLDWAPIAICEGHTESVGSIAFPNSAKSFKDLSYFFTGSQDRTIKMWNGVPLADSSSQLMNLKTLMTTKAHDKDINALDISPDDSLLASGSQDKTVKIFQIHFTQSKAGPVGELKLNGILKGHKRGVWDVKFHPSERILATGSGDKTVRVWSIVDSTCLKTLEEHTNSVLRIHFLNLGSQIASSSSDGLVKIWNLNEERCIATLDNHADKIWALSVTTDEKKIVSGAGDSIITIWEDVTAEKVAERENERTAMALQEQTFNNFVAINDFQNAFVLALTMDQPARLLSLFRRLTSDIALDKDSITGSQRVDEIIASLSFEDLTRLLRHVRTWNASSKTSGTAQRVLYAILKLRHHGDLREREGAPILQPDDAKSAANTKGHRSMRELVEGLIPYTERHLHRLDRLVQESYVIDHVIGEMDDGLIDIDQDTILV